MNHQEKALQLFHEGYNCAQAVFTAFADEMKLDHNFALRLSSSFGGGMGRMREVCGAVSGALMVLGALKGYDKLDDRSVINSHYAAVQELAKQFREVHGSIICRELLGLRQGEKNAPSPTVRTDAFYQERPCDRCIADAVRILEEMLK